MMEKQVVLVTDSTADIPRTLIEELGIYVIPLKVHFDGETFLDGESITPPLFYQKVSQVRDLPTTSQPSPLDFVSLYERIVEEHPGSHIVSIHLSGALSGTVQSAHIAREMVAGKIPVTVIDSKKASYAIGIIVVAAAEKAKKGVPVDPLLQYAWDLVGNTHVYFMVDTLHHLQKGGRIGRAQAIVGTLLNVKPILSLDEMGQVYAKEKARGEKKALQRILELLQQEAKRYHKIRLGISHADVPERANEVREMLEKTFPGAPIVVTEIGAVIGTHVGKGTVAIALAPDEE